MRKSAKSKRRAAPSGNGIDYINSPLALGDINDERLWSTYGGTVTPTAAEKVTAWFTCIKIIAATIAGLPKQLFKATADDERERVRDNRLAETLDKQPNEYQTGFEFWEYMMEQVLGCGAAFAEPNFEATGIATGFAPMRPIPTELVTPKRNTSGSYYYDVRQASGASKSYAPNELFRILWFTPDGVCWKSPVAVMADQLSGADSANVYISRYFKNSALPGGILESDKQKNETAAKELRESWGAIHGGPQNAGRTAVLWNGMKYKPLTPTMKDIEMTALQKASTAQIAAFFGVPLDMLGDMTGAKFANVEHKAIAFVEDTILPWCLRIEAAIRRDLIVESDQFVKFNINGLLRADFQTRIMALIAAVGGPFMVVNEARKIEDLKPIPGGDERLPPPNMSALPATEEEKPEPEPTDEEKAMAFLFARAAAKIAAMDWKQTGAKGYVVKQLEPIYRLCVNGGRRPIPPDRLYDGLRGNQDAANVLHHLRLAYGSPVGD